MGDSTLGDFPKFLLAFRLLALHIVALSNASSPWAEQYARSFSEGSKAILGEECGLETQVPLATSLPELPTEFFPMLFDLPCEKHSATICGIARSEKGLDDSSCLKEKSISIGAPGAAWVEVLTL